MWLLLVFSLLTCCQASTNNVVPSQTLYHSSPASTQQHTQIDEQLYSRQMLVYGAGAQARLIASTVLVHGNGPLAAEVIKNLALAGVGRLFVVDDEVSARLPLKGDAPSLSSYARELNPHITVIPVTLGGCFDSDVHYDVVVSTECSAASLLSLNAVTRSRGSRLVGCAVAGVCGLVFDDFLELRVTDAEGDTTLKDIPLGAVELLGEAEVRIESIEEEQLSLGIGDDVEVQGTLDQFLRGNVVRVLSPREVVLRLTGDVVATAIADSPTSFSVRKLKKQKTVAHKSLNDYLATRSSTFGPVNGCLSNRQNQALSLTLAAAFLALSEEQSTSTSTSADDADSWPAVSSPETFRDAVLQHLVRLGVSSPLHGVRQGGVGDCLDVVVERFFRSRRGRCPATVSVIGALASQEVIKALTGVHSPLEQMMFFESLDSLPSLAGQRNDTLGPEKEGDMVAVYGPSLSEALKSLRVFVVGAGAIGCELLKNFAMMGVAERNTAAAAALSDDATMPAASLWDERGLGRGGIVVADMDSIEKSNLNRQLLFRPQHIGRSKADTAALALLKINPSVRILGIDSKVGVDSKVFDSVFWDACSIVTTALDNVEARAFVDAMCVRHGRPMIDSGTQGTRGNTQVVLPHLTESYSSSSDPDDASVPICTLKSFPYLPEHCVAWAKSAFEAMFSADVAVLRSALLAVHQDSVAALTETLTPEELPRLIHNVAMCSPSAYHADVAVEWALLQFHDLFVRDIEALLATHPLDELDDQGQPFWSGSRRVPVALAFNSTDPAHSAFVRWAAVLKCKSAGWPEEDIERALVSIAEGTAPKENVPASQVDQQSELRRALKALKAADVDVVAVASALSEQQFEKDDPVLGHVDLVAAAAAIRSRSYGIRVVDKMEVQRIAGNIIPALATTTALVAGLVCLELMKVVRVGLEEGGEPRVDIFRNSFVNLALPELSFAEPVPSEVFSLGKGRYATQFSIWDQIASPSAVDELTISALQKLLWQRFGIRLESVSLGDTLLFADFMADADDRLGMTVLELAAATAEDSAVDDSDFIDDRAGASPVAAMIPTSGFIDLSVSCTDSDGEGVRVPPVRVSCVREARLNEGAREGKGVFRRLLSRAKQSAKKMLTKTK